MILTILKIFIKLNSKIIKLQVFLFSIVSFLLIKIFSWRTVARFLDKRRCLEKADQSLVELALEQQNYLNSLFWSKNCLVRSVTIYYIFKPYLPDLRLMIGH